jgi:hypothetical protein
MQVQPTRHEHRKQVGHTKKDINQEMALPYPHGLKEDWASKEYHLVPHHKCGSEMMMEAAHEMNKALKRHKTKHEHVPTVYRSSYTMGYGLNESFMQTPRPACYLQNARNPFEVVVSGYVYHMAASEPWCNESMRTMTKDVSHCLQYIKGGRMQFPCKPVGKTLKKPGYPGIWPLRTAHESIASVYHNSRAGPYADALPDAQLDESFSDYLSRVDTAQGLLAEYVFASHMSLPRMRWTHDFVETKPCSINTCYSSYYKDCDAQWQRVMDAWEIPESHRSVMLEGAKVSCPLTSSKEQAHSGADHLEQKDMMVEMPASEMVTLLKQIDRDQLNGELAALDDHVQCPLSSKYSDAA